MATKAYECGHCNHVHESHWQAERCCQPEVYDGWTCDTCGEFHEKKDDAVQCCSEYLPVDDLTPCPNCLRPHTRAQQVYAIEVAGHCSECNPNYTLEQRWTIEDRLDDLADQRAME